jgi:predicted DCC family thiol-disulfide oxidoreductase YuxK
LFTESGINLGEDPRPARNGAAEGSEVLFYDGSCGICRRTVMFVLARDRDDNPLLYAPLGGSTFKKLVPEKERAGLPDSIVLLTTGGRLLTRSTAALHVARRFSLPWRACAALGRIFPRPLRDCVYGAFARVRRAVSSRMKNLCPTVPAALQRRFLE